MSSCRIALALAIATGACAAPVPTASPTVSAPAITVVSRSPTPVATKAPPWTELRWSTPVPIPDQGTIYQVVSWEDGYVAAGQSTDNGQYVGELFASPDGVYWQRTAIVPLNPALVATLTRVVAVVTIGRDTATPKVESWASSDGGHLWQPQEALAMVGATIDHLASGGSTIVGVGTDSIGHATVWRSIDGAAWTRGDPPSAHAIVRDVSAVSDGFIALGREGEPDVASGGIGSPGVGLPAAWWSADGQTWIAAQVEGTAAAGAQLLQLFPVARGYFAVGSDTTAPSVNARSPLIWTSPDGRTWRLLGARRYTGPAGANGELAVNFAGAARSIEAHVTQDGKEWGALTFAGDLANIPNLPGFAQGAQLDQAFVMPHGIIVIGQKNGQPVAWFADAEPR